MSDTSPPSAIEARMASYYVKRAAYYERVYHKPERQVDLRAMERWLPAQFTGRRVLEIACGTGWWTPHGAARAAHWRATDLNPETLALARAKPAMPACELSTSIACAMLDNSFVQTSSTPITHSDAHGNTYQTRVLDDGSTHEVLKNFPTPEQAFAALGPRAREPQWLPFEHYWVLHYTLA